MTLSSHLDSDPVSAPPETSFAPPPWFRRIVAYGMDFLLLGVLIQLLGIFLPKLYGPEIEKEFQELFLAISHIPPEEQFDSEKMANFLKERNLSNDTYSLLGLIVVCAFALPCLYFFLGECFFRGTSLGKATFGLRAITMQETSSPSFLAALSRSILKGLATLTLLSPLLPIGLAYSVIPFFNRERRALHDLLSRTLTVQTLSNSAEPAATT